MAFDVSLAGHVNVDAVANVRTGQEDLGDSVDSSSASLLVTDAFAIRQTGSGNGLPNTPNFVATAFHPDISLNYLNSDNGFNAVQLNAGESFTTMAVDGFNFNKLHLLSMTGGGNAGVSVQLNYQDGTSTTMQATVPDWLDTVVDGSTTGDAVQYALIDGMDRYDDGFLDSNDAAIFGHAFDVDPTRVMSSITVTAGPATPTSAKLNVFGITLNEALDFGDLRAGNYPTELFENGARHVATGPRLGATVTTELDALSIDAGDDGVEFIADGTLSAGSTAQVRVTLENAGPTNRLDAWVDWNADGDFDIDEQIFDNLDLGAVDGDQFLSFEVPTSVPSTSSVARFRLSSEGDLGPGGFALDGEVEDYQIKLRNDGVHFSSLVGVDFDTAIGSSPNNWNQISDFDTSGQVFSGLISETGYTSPYTLELSSSLVGIDSFAEPILNDVPTHTNALDGLDGVISAPLAGSQAGSITAKWSGLRPFASYELYVFGLEGALIQGDLQISSDDAFPPLNFSQTSTNSELWVNAQVSNGDPLGSYAIQGVADQNGEISLSIQQNAGSDALSLAGLAIEQIAYPGPQVIAASVAPQDVVQPVDGFLFTATVDTHAMGPIGVEDVRLTGPQGEKPARSVTSVIDGNTTTYTFEFGAIPDGGYLLRLLSGDGQFEDLLGADLDGDESDFPGANWTVSFRSESIVDYGDAGIGSHPISLDDDGARHIVGGPTLGPLVDAEFDGLASVACCPFVSSLRDDQTDLNDEDGVTFAYSGDLVRGIGAPTRFDVFNADGVLNGWVDWNADGDWDDPGEQVFMDEALTVGSHERTIPVPADATLGVTYARFRISTAMGLMSTGLAPDGEVEDYQVIIREDPIQFTSLVGIDFDLAGATSPINWNQISGFDRAGEAFAALTAENGFESPYTLTLSSTTASSPTAFNGTVNPSTLPTHTQSLSGIDGLISTPSAEPGVITAEWSGLRVGVQYDVYVFAADGFTNSLDVTIAGSGAPTAFTQDLAVTEELWVNDEKGDSSRALPTFAVTVTPDADGRITITSTSTTALFNVMSALAIQQRYYSGPRVAFESIEHTSKFSLPPSEPLEYAVTFDTNTMGPIDVSDVLLTGANTGVHPALSVDVSPGPTTTTYVFDFGNVPSDQYTMLLLSGDGMFEDAVGTDMDGNTFGLTLPSGDGVPGGDRLISFTIQNPWHNPVFPEDINGDTNLNVTDLRQIFVYFNDGNSGDLDPNGPPFSGLMVDVNDDFVLSVTDLRLVFVGVTSGLQGPSGEGEGLAAPLAVNANTDEEEARWLAAWLAIEEEGWFDGPFAK